MIAFVTALYHLGTLITLGSLVRKLIMLHCLQLYCGVCHGLGKTETPTKVLLSILAQLEYSYLVRDYSDRQGVPFNQHLYVPQTHPVSNAPFCEREDEAHVLKVCDVCKLYGCPHRTLWLCSELLTAQVQGGQL